MSTKDEFEDILECLVIDLAEEHDVEFHTEPDVIKAIKVLAIALANSVESTDDEDVKEEDVYGFYDDDDDDINFQ